MDSGQVLALLGSDIISQDVSEFSKHLNLLPINLYEKNQWEQILAYLINLMGRNNNKDALYILDEFQRPIWAGVSYIPGPPFIVILALNPQISAKILRFVALNYPDITFTEAAYELNLYDDVPLVYSALNKLIDAFGEQDESVYRMLMDAAGEESNYFSSALIDRIVAISEFAPIPSWILRKKYDGAERKYIIEQRKDEIAEYVTETSLTELKKLIANSELKLDKISAEQIRGLAQWYLIEDDKEIFKLLGPLNHTPDGEVHSNSLGCRMLNCTAYEIDYDTEESLEWFDGSCDYCLRRIRVPPHAVRIALPYGGWRGCFCSWRCASNHLDKYVDMADRVISLSLMKRFCEDLYKIKLFDWARDFSEDVFEESKNEFKPKDFEDLIKENLQIHYASQKAILEAVEENG